MTTTTSTTTYNESQAAARLHVNPATLRVWRIKGKLADGIAHSIPSLAPGGTPKVHYDAAAIDGIVATGHTDDLFNPAAFEPEPEPS